MQPLPSLVPVRPALNRDGGRWAFRQAFYTLTFSYPVLWTIGAGGLYWILLAAPALWYLLRTRFSGLVWGVLAIPAILLLSSPIGLVGTSAGPTRLIGLAANIAVWVSVAAVIHLAETGDEARGLARAFTTVGFGQGLITGLAVVAYPTQLPIPLTKSFASRVPGGIGAFMENFLYFPSWLDGEQFRSAGIMGQPTWAGAVAALALLSALYAIVSDRGGWRVFAATSTPLIVLSISLSLSRATLLGLAAAMGVSALVVIGRRSSAAFWCLTTLALVAALITLITNGPAFLQWGASINSQREGSFDARSQIYGETWRLISEHPFPLLGYGVKPQDEGLVAPVATHSAYLGMLFRGGALGLVALWIVYLIVVRRCLKSSSFWGTSASLFLAVWSVLEDIDAGHLVPLGLALSVAWARSARADHPLTSATVARPTRPPSAGSGESARAIGTRQR